MSFFKRIDHVTYAVARGTIERWAELHLAMGGGQLVTRIDDVRPDDPDSSMKLWCVRNGEFGIALVEGIDRGAESQVSVFVRRHGTHSTQHVAVAVDDLEAYVQRLATLGIELRGEVVTRRDGFGLVKQVFTKGFEPGEPAETMFFEFVERPRTGVGAAEVTFSLSAGRGFYEQIERARADRDLESMFREAPPSATRISAAPAFVPRPETPEACSAPSSRR